MRRRSTRLFLLIPTNLRQEGFAVLTCLKQFVKTTPLANVFIFLKKFVARPRSQNDEGAILARLVDRPGIAKTFIEFGFSGWEFNCADLVASWSGLLVDGDRYNIRIARIILPKRVIAKQLWITLETLPVIREYADGKDIGVLSIDVDGNDYWFLKVLIEIRPAIIIAEYNSVFGTRSITVPYAPDFDRTNYPRWTYYGASLAAIARLTREHGYSLVAQTGGINIFFMRDDLLLPSDAVLDPADAYQARRAHEWAHVKDREFVTV